MDYERLRLSLERLLNLLEENDIPGLRKLGSELGEEALLENEKAFVQVAAAAYSAAKFLEKPHVTRSPQWKKFRQDFLKKTRRAAEAVENRDSQKISAALESLIREFERAGSALGRFHTNVVEKARIKIATDVYAHGASLGKAAELTGADKQQLLSYIGSTKLAEKYAGMEVGERLGKARKLFE